MAIISTIKLEPGMVLKTAVKDITGLLLLGKGSLIGKTHITMFKTWGVTEVDIEGEAQDDDVGTAVFHADDETVRNAEEEVQGLFAFTDLNNSNVTKEMFRLSVQHKTDILRGA